MSGTLTLVILAVACARNEGPIPEGCPPCGEGEICLSGQCVRAGCNRPCDLDEACVSGQCVRVGCEPACNVREECRGGECVPIAGCSEPCGAGQHCEGAVCVPDACAPACGTNEECRSGSCVPRAGCSTACEPGQRCDGTRCVENVCAPACAANEYCAAHGGSECLCSAPPCEQPPPPACADGRDNDGDGWTDADDPDCAQSSTESGPGRASCNDGADNDGDGHTDVRDPECAGASDDEVLGSGPCVDSCAPGALLAGQECRLWDRGAQTWLAAIDDGPGHLRNRARNYTAWLRAHLLPEGGVMRAQFTDASLNRVAAYGGTRDSPIWTGTYLAAEALRLMTTGDPDAAEQIDRTVRVLDRWWRISGDQGFLARYAVPTTAAPEVLAIFNPADPEMHLNVPFEGAVWHWRGNVSRDQYQGVMLGFSLAYEATSDERLKEIIRADVVTFIERLMRRETRPFDLVINGIPLSVDMDVEHAVYTDDETPNGRPSMIITTNPFEASDLGFLTFWPTPSRFLRQVPLLGWLPDIYLRSQAIQLGSMFAVALQVTQGVSSYAARRQAILQHYEAHVGEWLDIAAGWRETNRCGDSYHGLNIAFEPIFNWARVETDPARKARLQTEVLRDAMWSQVDDHKNVFFAFIYASQASAADDTSSVVSTHVDQLAQFPPAPYLATPRDNTATYPADPSCDGLSSVAVDVRDRVPAGFIWERNPWKLFDPGTPNFGYPGVDYLVAYWMGRRFGLIAEDSPSACLRWSAR